MEELLCRQETSDACQEDRYKRHVFLGCVPAPAAGTINQLEGAGPYGPGGVLEVPSVSTAGSTWGHQGLTQKRNLSAMLGLDLED